MIGLKRGTVKLVPHNPIWTDLFEEEKRFLESIFGDTIIAIEHIGSTAIPGIPAKPIIDINIGVESLKVALAMKGKFEESGYEHRPFVPGNTIEDLKLQELYVRGSEACRTHHIHVTVYGSDYWNDDLLFRDYLRRNHDRALEYAELKTRLAREYLDDRRSYTKGKHEFIQNTLEMAKSTLE
ncbi:MAG: GrpB family protein [Armatimonadota bacterium]